MVRPLNVVCAPEFGTNLRLADGASTMVTIAYMGMELQRDWPSPIMSGKFCNDAPLILDFLFNIFALKLATDAEVLNFVKLQKVLDTVPTKRDLPAQP